MEKIEEYKIILSHKDIETILKDWVEKEFKNKGYIFQKISTEENTGFPETDAVGRKSK